MGVEDSGSIAIMLFIVAVMLIAIYVIASPLVDALLNQAEPTIGTPAKTTFHNGFYGIFPIIDGGMAFIAAAMLVGALISAFYTRSHPIFAILGLIVTSIMVVIGWMLSGIFSEFIASSLLASGVAQFPITVALLSNLPLWVLIACGSIMAVIYIKPSPDTGYSGY